MLGVYVRGAVSIQSLGFEPNVAVHRRTDTDDTHDNHVVISKLSIIITTVIMLTIFGIIHILAAIMIVIIIVLMFSLKQQGCLTSIHFPHRCLSGITATHI